MQSLALLVGGICAALSAVSGHVVDASGQPVSGARVFLEPGLTGTLTETTAGPAGAFRFEQVEAVGSGLFAHAAGHAWGGQHVALGADDEVSGLVIRLAAPAAVMGYVRDAQGEAVKGARILRVGLIGEEKVGIPLAKLKAFGFDEPETDAEGGFLVPDMPEAGTIMLKIGHPGYAQQTAAAQAGGGRTATVTLERGVLVSGAVLSRDQALPVAHAQIVARNAEPPHATALARTDGAGRYAMRLMPGAYLFQTAGAAYKIPSWDKHVITGREPEQQVNLSVVGTGEIAGEVRDAVTGGPIARARLAIEANGHVSALVRTGASGAFVAEATEGENVVRLDAMPGYMPPEPNALQVQVVAGKRVEIPPFWAAPIPTFTVRLVDETGAPAPGAVVQVLRPAQLGWLAAGEEGCVALQTASLPEDKTIVGLAEDPARPRGALFALHAERIEQAKVALMPLGRVEGEVHDDGGECVEGAVVTGLFAHDAFEEPLVLWRTVGDKKGRFAWPMVPAGVPQQCLVMAGEDHTARSIPFNLPPGEALDLGHIVVSDGEKQDAHRGRSFKWHDGRLLAGDAPDRAARGEKPALVVCCAEDEAAMVAEALATVRRVLGADALHYVACVDGAFGGGAPEGVLVYEGRAPGVATTYLVQESGKVAWETFGLPPVCVVKEAFE